MSAHLREVWRKVAATNWRGFADSPIWREHDAVIMPQERGRGRYYEVYTYGEVFGHFDRLDDAKNALWRIYGDIKWEHIKMPKVWVEHYYFGWTDEFTDPTNVYVAKLPKLGKVASRDHPSVREALSLIPPGDRSLIAHVEFKYADPDQKGWGPMWYDDRDQAIYFYEGNAPVGSMVHEIGHAIDHALGFISHTRPFQVITNQYPDFISGRAVHGRGRDSKYEEAWARGYAALYGGVTPVTWPGNDSDLARVIREARTHSSALGKMNHLLAQWRRLANLSEAMESWEMDGSMELTHAAADLVDAPGWSGGGEEWAIERAAILLDAIDASPTVDTLYSGHGGHQPGSTWVIPLMATTTSRQGAEGFARDVDGVVYTIKGARGLAINSSERLISGVFSVDGLTLTYRGPAPRRGPA